MFSPRGAGSDVLVGVRVGRNCMFGCGAVMASAIPPSVVADGSRERVLRRLGKIE
jgi:acetyltransferase-like isoleucine patch superfamily enzyme